MDLPEGKNLLGAFHHPSMIVLDVAALRPLPERQRRAALGEIVHRPTFEEWVPPAPAKSSGRKRGEGK